VQECLWKSHNKCSSFSWRLVHRLFSVIGYSGRKNGKWDCDLNLAPFRYTPLPPTCLALYTIALRAFIWLPVLPCHPSFQPSGSPLANFTQTGRQGRGTKGMSFLHSWSEWNSRAFCEQRTAEWIHSWDSKESTYGTNSEKSRLDCFCCSRDQLLIIELSKKNPWFHLCLAYTTGIEMGVPIQTFEVMKKTHNNPLWKDKATLLVMYLCCAMHPSQKKYHRISLCLFLE